MNILKVASPKKIMKVELGRLRLKEIGEVRKLYRIYGSVASTSEVPTAFGKSTCLHGIFRGIIYDEMENEIETFESPKGYIPEEHANFVETQLHAKPDKNVEFAFDVSIVTVLKRGSETDETDYEYQYDSLLDIDAVNPLAELESRMLANIEQREKEKEKRLLAGPKKKKPKR